MSEQQQMDYVGTLDSAVKIQTLATEMKEILDKVKMGMGSLPDSYKSDASRAIINRFEELSAKFPGFVQEINNFSDFLRKTVETYQNADATRAGSV